jgi:hypothetical protein
VSTYFIVATSFAVLGIYVFALFRWWHRRLVSFASQCDFSERRRRATRLFFLIALLFYVPALAVLLAAIIRAKVDGLFLLVCLFLSLAPGFVWYARRIPGLRTFGYYGGQS